MLKSRNTRFSFLSSGLCRLYIAAACIALSILSADCTMAQTRYVKPSAEVVVRRGKGNEYKIVSMVKDGDSVELLREDEGYALVRLRNGKEGWMLRRFLSTEPPLEDVVASLRAEREKLLEQEKQAAAKLEEFSSDISSLQAQFNEVTAERDLAIQDYQTLKRDTADVVQIKDDMQRVAEENEQLVLKLSVLEQENSKLKKDTAINWFLAGAGVFLGGMIVGRMPRPSRKRKSSLLS